MMMILKHYYILNSQVVTAHTTQTRVWIEYSSMTKCQDQQIAIISIESRKC